MVIVLMFFEHCKHCMRTECGPIFQFVDRKIEVLDFLGWIAPYKSSVLRTAQLERIYHIFRNDGYSRAKYSSLHDGIARESFECQVNFEGQK